ncbi:MAG: hypothetical protein V1755_08385 [Chloroflexota bacterium]
MEEQKKSKSLASRVVNAVFSATIVLCLACGPAGVIMHMAPNSGLLARARAIEARQDCAEYGHNWKFVEVRNDGRFFIIIGSSCGPDTATVRPRWNFRCASCKKEMDLYESDMTDEFWAIVEHKSGLNRPKKKHGEEPNNIPLSRLGPPPKAERSFAGNAIQRGRPAPL